MRRLLVLAPLSACTPTPVDCATLTDPSLAVGGGSAAFVPLAEGAELPWERGGQGGYHVWGSLRARDIEPGDPGDYGSPLNPVVTFTVEHEGEIVGGYGMLPRAFSPGPDGAWDLAGEQLVLDVGDPTELAGLDLVLHGVVEDACGSRLDASVGVRVVAP